MCDNFKYLGITFDCKLKCSNHCTLIVSKCKQRLFFLRLLNSFGVKNDILHVFFESIIFYNISLWWSSMNENDKKALNRITTQLAKYLGPMWFLLGLCRAQVPHVKPTWVCNGPSGPRCPMLCPLGCLLGYMDDTNCVIKLGFNWVIWAEHA